MKEKIDVLNLEWSSFPSRDRQMATLICNYLRYMGYTVLEESLFNGYHLLNKYKPKIFFTTNTLGADINFLMIKYASKKDITGVSLVSEGNFKDGKENVDQFLWGWNTDRVLYETLHMQWSERTRTMSLKYYPELKDKIKVSGGVGFDVYKISHNQQKTDFLKRYNKQDFKKIIGIGCWNFGFFYEEDPHYPMIQKKFSADIINRFKEDGKQFNRILKEVIAKNNDILFLLKEHPGSLLGKKSSAIENTEQYPNVLILKNEEAVIDCINVSDFWLVYESTTAIEAWLLRKQTGLLNPSGIDFPRDEIYRGSPNYHSYEDLQQAIHAFYHDGFLPHFHELEKNRRKIISDVMQWDDGLNHVRSGNEIIDLIERNPVQHINKDTIQQLVTRYWQMFEWYFFPVLRFIPKINRYYLRHQKRFNKKELNEFQEKRMKEQIEFYKKNGLAKSDFRKIKCL